jgi:hypothetical protein
VLEQLNGFYAGQQVQLASDSLVTKFLAHTGLWRNDESSLLSEGIRSVGRLERQWRPTEWCR